jgi:hypothetical protein
MTICASVLSKGCILKERLIDERHAIRDLCLDDGRVASFLLYFLGCLLVRWFIWKVPQTTVKVHRRHFPVTYV